MPQARRSSVAGASMEPFTTPRGQNCSKPGLCCSAVLPLANHAWKRYRLRKFERKIRAPQRTSSAHLHRPWHTNRSVTHLARRLGCRPSERDRNPYGAPSGHSLAWPKRVPRTHETGGSNPPALTSLASGVWHSILLQEAALESSDEGASRFYQPVVLSRSGCRDRTAESSRPGRGNQVPDRRQGLDHDDL